LQGYMCKGCFYHIQQNCDCRAIAANSLKFEGGIQANKGHRKN